VTTRRTIVLTYPRAQAILQASWNWSVSRKDMEVHGARGYVLAPTAARSGSGATKTKAEETPPTDARPAPAHDPFAYLAAVVRGSVAVEPADLSALANNVTVAHISTRPGSRRGPGAR